MTWSEDLWIKLNPVDLASTLRAISTLELRFEVSHDLLAFDHIFEHGFDFIDCVVTALNLKFIDHEFFCGIRYTCLVQ